MTQVVVSSTRNLELEISERCPIKKTLTSGVVIVAQ